MIRSPEISCKIPPYPGFDPPHGQRLLLRPSLLDFRTRPHPASARRALGRQPGRLGADRIVRGAAVGPGRSVRHRDRARGARPLSRSRCRRPADVFETLARDYGPDREKLSQAIESWRAQPNDNDASDLHFASEPRRQELFRRLNRAPGGTSDLVAMRADLLALMKGNKDLAALDRDVVHLVFLVQQGISRAAQDRLVDASQYSGTDHPLRGGARNPRLGRFAPPHRPDRPALLRVLSPAAHRRAADLRRGRPDRDDPGRDCAAARRRPAAGADRTRAHRGVLFDFEYAERTWRHFLRQFPDQAGGRGIAARTAEARHFRHAVAGAGLHAVAEAGRRCSGHRRGTDAAGKLDKPDWFEDPELTAQLRAVLEPLAAHYFLKARTPKGRLIDSVARFHSATARGWRRSTGSATSRPRACANPQASWSTTLPAGRHREEPRGLRQPGRGRRLQRGEENAEARGPAATGYAAVVERSYGLNRRSTGTRLQWPMAPHLPGRQVPPSGSTPSTCCGAWPCSASSRSTS